MSLKMTFLGTGSAFTVGESNFQSNVLLEMNGDSLLIDAGTDIRLALFDLNLSYHHIHNIYISHLHSDHVGGLEWLAITTFFDPKCKDKINLIISKSLLKKLWDNVLSGGLSTLASEQTTIDTFFNVQSIENSDLFLWQNIEFKLIQMNHVYNNYHLMPCFGLLFAYESTKIFYSADTQYNPYLIQEIAPEVDLIFHDCETLDVKSGVHAHYNDLQKFPEAVKKKMWLYHYNPGPLPNAKKDGFLGFVRKGQVFIFE